MSEVGVIFGGPSPEHDVSVLTGLQAARGLTAAGRHRVRALYWAKTGEWFEVRPDLEGSDFLAGVPRGALPLRLTVGPGGGFAAGDRRLGRARPVELDVALVCCHGGPGEDGTLQAALDLAGLPYSGPTAAQAALGMDKLAFAGVTAAAGLPMLPRSPVDADTAELPFDGPYIVKPRFGGSSIGIEVVEDLATARVVAGSSVHLARGAVIEPFRPDLFDLQVAVRSWPGLALSAIERPLRSAERSSPILDYRDKYMGGEGMASAPRELPAELDPAVAGALREAALAIARRVPVRGLVRVDFLSDGTSIYLNEINTVPGSLSWYLWIDPKIPFEELLSDLIEEALTTRTASYVTAGADGTALRDAASIAAKLA